MQSFVTEMVQATVAAIALTGGIDQGQVAGPAGFQKIILQSDGEMLGEADADKAAGGDGIAAPISRTASSAVTILSLLVNGWDESRGWGCRVGMNTRLQMIQTTILVAWRR